MKKLKYIAILAGLLTFSSCESWLDEDPKYTLSNVIEFKTEANAQMALTACYGYLSSQGGYGQFWQAVPVMASGYGWVMTRNDEADKLCSLKAAVDSRGQLDWIWKGMYKTINETNLFIVNVNESPLSEDVKLRMSSEAKFLRAIAFYNLVTTWGDVPLRNSPSSYDAAAMGRTPKAEVFAQVEKDLTEALGGLPETAAPGYATRWAAKAFLGKLYYTLACLGDQSGWGKAKTLFDEIYAAKPFELEPKFSNLFVNHVNTKESVFQLNYTATSDYVSNRGNMQFAGNQSTGIESYGNVRLSKAFYDLFRGTYPGDPRIDATFQTRWRALLKGGVEKPMVEPVPSARDTIVTYPLMAVNVVPNVTPPGWSKLKQVIVEIPYEDLTDPKNPSIAELNASKRPYIGLDAKGKNGIVNRYGKATAEHQGWPHLKKVVDTEDKTSRSGKNVILYRYADMLLMMADVYNELGDKGKAIDLADEVLLRARTSGPKPSTQPAKWPSTLTKDEVTEKIYFERIFELAGEPSMYQIMRGRGPELLKKALEYHNRHEITISEAATLMQVPGNKHADRLLNASSPADSNPVLTEDFLKKNLLLPIPKTEIDYNADINYTDNNFGYSN